MDIPEILKGKLTQKTASGQAITRAHNWVFCWDSVSKVDRAVCHWCGVRVEDTRTIAQAPPCTQDRYCATKDATSGQIVPCVCGNLIPERYVALGTQCVALMDRLENIDRDCDGELSKEGREYAIEMLVQFAIRVINSPLPS